MMEILTLIFVAIVFFHAGYKVREIVAKQTIKRFQEDLADDLEELQTQFKEVFVNLKVEQHGESLFLYDFATSQFICQGKTRTEVLQNFHKIYPNKKGLIHDGIEIWRKAHD